MHNCLFFNFTNSDSPYILYVCFNSCSWQFNKQDTPHTMHAHPALTWPLNSLPLSLRACNPSPFTTINTKSLNPMSHKACRAGYDLATGIHRQNKKKQTSQIEKQCRTVNRIWKFFNLTVTLYNSFSVYLWKPRKWEKLTLNHGEKTVDSFSITF